MSSIFLEAETRVDMGKGASRRLRRLDNKVPGILYGGEKKPVAIHLQHNKVIKALENESIFSSVFDLHVDGKVEHVILKDMQRHPFKPVVLHMDLQRVSAKDVLIRNVPLHFLNESTARGVKAGGKINHAMTQIEIRCQAKSLPEFIEVDLLNLGMDEVLHLADLTLPKGVQFSTNVNQPEHNLPVVSIHAPKGDKQEEPAESSAEESTGAAE